MADIEVIGAQAIASGLARVRAGLDDLRSPRQTAETGSRVARSSAPYRTGRLRGSISSRSAGAGQAELVATAPYAPFVEFGTRYMAAQPFFRPAVNEMAAELERETFAEIDGLLANVRGA